MLFNDNKPRLVPIDRLNFKFDVRLTGNDLDQVEQMQAALENGQVLPPVIVNQRYEIVEGRQRWEAAKRAGKREISIVMQAFSDSKAERVFAVNAQLNLAAPLDKESIRWNIRKLLIEGMTSSEVVAAFSNKLASDVVKRYTDDALSTINKQKIRDAIDRLGAGASKARVLAETGITEKQLQGALGYRKQKIRKGEKLNRKALFGTAVRTLSRKLEDQRKSVLRDLSETTLTPKDAEEIVQHAYVSIQTLCARMEDYKLRLYQAVESAIKMAETRAIPRAVMAARAK